MKLLFVYGDWSLGGRPIDFAHLETGDRGLTGSELSFLTYAKEMRRRGHEVGVVVTSIDKPETWEGCRVFGFDGPDGYPAIANDGEWDGILVWNEPNMLSQIEKKQKMVRFVDQQLNDFNYCAPDWCRWVDVMTTPAMHHQRFLRTQTRREWVTAEPFGMGPSPHGMAWDVLPNGCYPPTIDPSRKVPGRVIYASSPDRGLHLLLQAWPEIRREVRGAHLRIFYSVLPWIERMRGFVDSQDLDMRTLAWRAIYVEKALERLRGEEWGVELVGQVGRDRIAKEMQEAEVLAYSCLPIRYTEGFSVTTMEACANGGLPVVTSADSLEEIYGGSVPMVAPDGAGLLEFPKLVVRGLTDPEWRAGWTTKARALAERHAWPILAERLERILEEARVRLSPPPVAPVDAPESLAKMALALAARVASPEGALRLLEVLPHEMTSLGPISAEMRALRARIPAEVPPTVVQPWPPYREPKHGSLTGDSFPRAATSPHAHAWAIPEASGVVDLPLRTTDAQLLSTVLMLWRELMLHDEVLSAVSLLENAPFRVRHHATVEAALRRTKATLAWMDDPVEFDRANTATGPDGEMLTIESGTYLPWPLTNQLGQRYSWITARLRTPGASILDLGCNDGAFCNRWGLAGFAPVGVDASTGALRVARAKAEEFSTGARFVQSLFERATIAPGLSSRRFDYVACADTYEHLTDPVASLLVPARELLKPDSGRLLLVTPAGAWMRGEYVPWAHPWIWGNEPGGSWLSERNRAHVVAPTVWSLVRLFRKHGWYVHDCLVVPSSPVADVPGQGNVCMEASPWRSEIDMPPTTVYRDVPLEGEMVEGGVDVLGLEKRP